MRLAGTISYPTPEKVERGYIAELVTLHIRKDAPTYTVEQLTGVTGKASGPFDFNKAAKPGRNDDELKALLEASRVPGKWHNSMLDAIATMIGRGWSDTTIRLACAPYCWNGAEDADLDDLIDGAREKWNKPDPETRRRRLGRQERRMRAKAMNDSPTKRPSLETLSMIKGPPAYFVGDDQDPANADCCQGAFLSARRRTGATDHPHSAGRTRSADQNGAIETHQFGLHARHHVPSCALGEI